MIATPPHTFCYCCADTTTGFRFRIGRRKELYSIQRIRIHFPHNNVEFDFALARICAPECSGLDVSEFRTIYRFNVRIYTAYGNIQHPRLALHYRATMVRPSNAGLEVCIIPYVCSTVVYMAFFSFCNGFLNEISPNSTIMHMSTHFISFRFKLTLNFCMSVVC